MMWLMLIGVAFAEDKPACHCDAERTPMGPCPHDAASCPKLGEKPPPPKRRVGAIILSIDSNRPADRSGGALGTLKGVPGGRWRMGSPDAEGGADDEHPQVETQVGPRLWMEVEFTRGMWAAIGMTSTPWGDQACAGLDGLPLADARACPVTKVSWCDAVIAANRASAAAGLAEAYTLPGGFVEGMDLGTCNTSANTVVIRSSPEGYVLPAEAQWEWAARGGQEHRYAGSKDALVVGWIDDNTDTLRASRLKQANGWGLYDMTGNVWEWAADSYEATLKGGAEPFVVWNALRGIRGGGWNYSARDARVADRDGRYPGFRLVRLGFRLTRSSLDP